MDREPSRQDRNAIGRDIQKVEVGWPLGMLYRRSLGDRLGEVRSDLTAGRIARVIFCVTRGNVVPLHGFVKKTQKLTMRDRELARTRMKELR